MAALDDHLAIILAGLAAGRCIVTAGRDDRALAETAAAMAALGAVCRPNGAGWEIVGTGNGCLLEPVRPLTVEVEATPALLLTGLLAACDMPARITCRAPVAAEEAGPLAAALGAMGAQLAMEPGPPFRVAIRRQPSLHPWVHVAAGWSETTVAAVLLAALNTPGTTRLKAADAAPRAAADRLSRFGVDCGLAAADGLWSLAVRGRRALKGPGAAAAI